MTRRKAFEAVYMLACMLCLGFLIGFEYQELANKQAGFIRWTGGILAVIGWCCILWNAAFRFFRSSKKKKTITRNG